MIFDHNCRFGAHLQTQGVRYGIWAPKCQSVDLKIRSRDSTDERVVPMRSESDGYFTYHDEFGRAGDRYGFYVDHDRSRTLPDPASRFQPDGPFGLSQVVDPTYDWTDHDWTGSTLHGQVVYELHIGTFTIAGTWRAAIERLPKLRELGITLIEVMPVNEFDGEFGWGYDGVDLYAPTRLYGTPDDFRAFVDAAHGSGIGVILDVVYNHLGPSGNFLPRFSEHYMSEHHRTDWGDAINYDDEFSAPVRDFFIGNAGYWISEYHLDGLRLDAIHSIKDDSPEHVIGRIGRAVRSAAQGRKTVVIVENEQQKSEMLRSAELGGHGLDAAWNDDYHHAVRVAVTGHADFYYGDYQGTPQEILSAVKWGYLFQGQWSPRTGRPRGTPGLDLAASQFVTFIQNHDQVGNTPLGKRLHELTSPGRSRAVTALLLLGPATPMLFQGQEYEAPEPFHYFADHRGALGKLVRGGREREIRQFRCLAGEDAAPFLLDPCDRTTFEACKLREYPSGETNASWRMHRDLIALRRNDPVFSAQRGDLLFGAVLAAEAFVLRFVGIDGDDRLMIVNLGRQLHDIGATEPLMAPPSGCEWKLYWSTENPLYGGSGSGPNETHLEIIPGHATLVYRPAPLESP